MDLEIYHIGKVFICGVFAWVVCILSGCGMMGSSIAGSEHGQIHISADAEGMRSFSDFAQGLVVNGKSSSDSDTTHYQMRREQIRAKVVKFSHKNNKVK